MSRRYRSYRRLDIDVKTHLEYSYKDDVLDHFENVRLWYTGVSAAKYYGGIHHFESHRHR